MFVEGTGNATLDRGSPQAMILLIDNYDSFTYNLVQYLGEVSHGKEEIAVYRNDALTLSQIEELNPSRIVISPGPCTPNEAGVSLDAIFHFKERLPILGICLGHQAIGQAFGGTILRAPAAVHGKTTSISHTGKGIFYGIPQGFTATRYHSLVVDEKTLPACLQVTARSLDGQIMGLVHTDYPTVVGLQFHPESFMTSYGKELLQNFLTF